MFKVSKASAVFPGRTIQKPDKTLTHGDEGVATGIAQCAGELVTILDFEKIVTDINPETGLRISEIDELGTRTRSNVPILIAEDSVLLNRLIVNSLKKAGYDNLTRTYNGQEAYEFILECKSQGTLKEDVQCIITDIEMPLMDGHRLVKLVREDDAAKDIPIIIFSSLVNDDMRRKGEALGANAQLSKPEIGELVNVLDNLLLKNKMLQKRPGYPRSFVAYGDRRLTKRGFQNKD